MPHRVCGFKEPAGHGSGHGLGVWLRDRGPALSPGRAALQLDVAQARGAAKPVPSTAAERELPGGAPGRSTPRTALSSSNARRAGSSL
eukprot:10698982-Lingulodinium_polyedra.AAC.1